MTNNDQGQPATPPERPLQRVGSAWAKAQTHFEMAKAAMKLAARNEAGAAMAAEHLERAAASLRGVTPN